MASAPLRRVQVPDPARRAAMRQVAGGLLLAARPDLALAAPLPAGAWPGAGEVRQIWITRCATGETAVLRYFDGRQLDMQQYLRACTILRDVQAGQIANIDVLLLDLMFAMQRWLVSWGVDRPLMINSGYRSRATNDRTEGAARKSMHLQGRAADILMPGVPAEYLGRLAAVFGRGGVGFYVDRGFVHIDTGTVRYWRAPGRISATQATGMFNSRIC